jgi:acyl-CoA synthetase (AMP-forming)/AMP-acid ligase II
MLGLMQDKPLLISSMIDHAEKAHGDTEIVSRLIDGTLYRTTYAQTAQRSRQLANALRRLQVEMGDRVATLAWNTHRHLEIYYAVSGSGAVCHTINPRLFAEQIDYIVEHAEDTVLFFELTFTDIARRLAAQTKCIRHFVALCQPQDVPEIDGVTVLSYEALLAAEPTVFDWPVFDENTASSLCYTSGTTGNPKGVLYSHRSTVLHAMASVAPDAFDISSSDVVMPASSMYHANAWGLPYAITLTGAKMVLPCNQLDGASLAELINAEGVTLSCGVPTIWLGVIQHLERTGCSIPSVRELIIGGAACPPALMQDYRDRHGIEVIHLWGMTETSPLGTVGRLKRKHEGLSTAEKDAIRAKQGRVMFGVELKIQNDAGQELPHDGIAFGDLMVRGWWISKGYYRLDTSAQNSDGWFHTGDVSTLDSDGYMRITDRSKDVIKSGGEWISSIDLENAAIGHPDVAEAAVVGVRHPKWDERPVMVVVPKAGRKPSEAEIRLFLSDKVAKWWMPDRIFFTDAIPHTATGKILKTALRDQYADALMSSVAC